eukprot:TRINITY_DN3617_c0_g3_i1.p2 TRINITY_DN3617_c0_g3~~TRINITY_DN3617_c0_g3_i1.p2  ORF type:complete len:294 (+),score=27.48 TRINITY_DN3617_c0_g3_i1:65-946(+)
MAGSRDVALVTGASRGIGRAAAVALARKGFCVAVASRTVAAGDINRYGAATAALPGSLEETAAAVRAAGSEALVLRVDLTERASVEAAVPAVLRRWGRLNVLVNSGVYQGAEVPIADQSTGELEAFLEANVVAPFLLVRASLPELRRSAERGRPAAVLNLASYSSRADPTAPVGHGGWGWAYAASKAALGRMAGVLAVEMAQSGVRIFNVDPGMVHTALMQRQGVDFSSAYGSNPPDVAGEVVAWLATSPGGEQWNGKLVYAPKLAAKHGLLAGYRPDAATLGENPANRQSRL